MYLGDDDCYLALKARDTRFDGQFFTCVKSTGIYCRPVCPARTPRRSNCTFVASAAAAEDAGYRPCLRCRPESAPGSPEWLGSESVVQRALRIINDSAGSELSVARVCNELGISTRQLRRIFAQVLGTSPKSVFQTNRIALARQLLIDTNLPVAEVAMSSGFGSIRRFNTVIRQAFGLTPTAMRREHGRAPITDKGVVQLHLGYRPPFAWRALLEHFAARGVPGLEAVDNAYVRTIRIGAARGHLRVTNDPDRRRVRAQFRLDATADLTVALNQVRDMLDLDAAPGSVAKHLQTDSRLRSVVKANPGLRCPGAWNVYEMLVRAIVGQQVSVAAARTVLGRLVSGLGEAVMPDESEQLMPNKLFPDPEVLARESLQPFGLNTARAETINRISAKFAEDPQFIRAGMPVETARARLLAIRGIGPWTADYVLLRGLRYPDAFPSADHGAMKAAGVRKPADLAAMAERWRPWRGYALLYLWKSLEQQS